MNGTVLEEWKTNDTQLYVNYIELDSSYFGIELFVFELPQRR